MKINDRIKEALHKVASLVYIYIKWEVLEDVNCLENYYKMNTNEFKTH